MGNVLKRITAAAESCGRDPGGIKLVAVTKTHSPEMIEEAIRSGVEFIGENKVQEAEAKLSLIKEKYNEFHYIGHLQSNKINKLLKLDPDLIHSIDKFKTARKLSNSLSVLDKSQKILIQVNTSGEESKFGVEPSQCQQLVSEIDQLPGIKICGLMTIGKLTTDPNQIRSCFKTLRELFESLREMGLRNGEMRFLSMGMTADFEIAIEEGANIVRIGSAIFGPREY